MKALFDDRQWAHDPKHFVNSGPIADNPERLKRIEVLSHGVIKAGCTLKTPTDFGMDPIAEIHSPRYLRFLKNISYVGRSQ